ncbi:MAG: nucleotidyl transferase AbiEii/AbiGii toxin family protein, partial [Prevotellaceae bacterium]|nr:nucleotidyl transferase AbiEii/AbiGii toxin family protein [Prevotellaceae bacterium]
MIPILDIKDWENEHPWKKPSHVEQDLLLSRAIVEIFSDNLLRKSLIFRGGTALHKLFIHPQVRYSEDIDLI